MLERPSQDAPRSARAPIGLRADESGDHRSFERDFPALVRDALAHLYDPAYLQTHPLTGHLQAESGARRPVLGRLLRQSLLEAIEALHPGPDHPSDLARHSTILQLRYVEGLEPQEVQSRLALSRTHYYREQAAAVTAVASILQSRWQVDHRAHEATGASPQGAHRPPAPQAAVPRHNLPIALTSFVGRGRQIAEVKRLLEEARLLTLTGTGGCGKTRLALEVAEQLLQVPDRYPDGIWLVELAPLSDPALVAQTVAFVLDIREQPGQPLLTALVAALGAKKLLLVLDNCEHLLDVCAELVERLLLACPHLKILATSRELLGAAGEVAWRVPSLTTPDPHDLPSAEHLSDYEAVRLFVERARLVQPSFELTESNAFALAEVCSRLDGVPLAIELAAARVRGLTVDQIRDRLSDRFGLLTGGRRTALRRQQTLRATIDWSHDLLSESERVLLRRLAVFSGGWTLEAAEAVSAGGEVETGDVVDFLLRLVDRSLVVAEAEREPARYRLPETIRQYAQEKLFESGEVAMIRDRHFDWYLALAERASPELWGAEQRDWLNRLERDRDNLRSALDWSLAQESNPDNALRLLVAMGEFWARRYRASEMRSWLQPVLARRLGEPRVRVTLLGYAGVAESLLCNWQTARRYHEEALALAREVGDDRLTVNALSKLRYSVFDLGDYAETRLLSEESLALARRLGDRFLILRSLVNSVFDHYYQGDYATVRPLIEEGLAIGQELGEQYSLFVLRVIEGYLAIRDGDLETARTLGETSMATARKAATGPWGAYSLLSNVARAEGDLATAKAHIRDALKQMDIRQRIVSGDWLRATSPLLFLAGVWTAEGKAREAAMTYGVVHGWLEIRGIRRPWAPPPTYEQDQAAAREILGEEAFARAWAEGQAMTLDQAVQYALADEG